MVTFAIGLTHILDGLEKFCSDTKHIGFADGLTGTGKSHQLKLRRKHLQSKETEYSYYPKPSKSSFTVKQ